MHYVFTRILHHSRAVLDHASMKAEILHFQTCPNRLICLEQASGITGPVLPAIFITVWDFCPRFDFTNFDVSTTRLEAAGPRFERLNDQNNDRFGRSDLAKIPAM
ncbi:hypothetical protein T05_5798 [Trichinella murrelli]|uniref:Uncharacterized protein n=1 Tax=Trichinella murrelli TaxID=144512 RepID=A0A0V0UGB8_9BILA|nr:hypothetical protein T05_5798 [Trichinella murrelli]